MALEAAKQRRFDALDDASRDRAVVVHARQVGIPRLNPRDVLPGQGAVWVTTRAQSRTVALTVENTGEILKSGDVQINESDIKDDEWLIVGASNVRQWEETYLTPIVILSTVIAFPGSPEMVLGDILVQTTEDLRGDTEVNEDGMPVLNARHKRTGEVLAQAELPIPAQYGMMTYMHEGRQYIVVAVGSGAHPGSLVALRAP